MDFRWTPHQGANPAAIERMKQHFKKPSSPPPEAWFNTQTQMYHHGLFESLTTERDLGHIRDFLFDTGGGIKIFGRFTEWVEWFHCLFPYLLENILEDEFLPLTLSYFINLYPDDITEEYSEFREDVLITLPHCIMTSALWDGQDLLKDHWWLDVRVGDWRSSLSATMFFCLKYLKPDEIPSWVASIADIQGKIWHETVSEWLTGASLFFYYAQHPQEIPPPDEQWKNRDKDDLEFPLEASKVDWNGSYHIFGGASAKKAVSDYWSDENLAVFWSEVKKYPQLSFTSKTP